MGPVRHVAPGLTLPCHAGPHRYKSHELPPTWAGTPATWQSMHPDWEYRFWTDQDLEDLIRDSYPWFLDAYLAYPEPIQKVDAARYFILHKYGGVYTDLDILPTQDISPMLQFVDVVLPVTPNVGLTNAFLASTKKSHFFEFLMHQLPVAQHHWYNGMSRHLRVITGAGPYFLWGQFNEYNKIYRPKVEGGNPFLATPTPSRIGLAPNWLWGKCSLCNHNCNKRILSSGKMVDVQPFMSHLHGDSWHSFDSWVWSYVVQCYTPFVVVSSWVVMLVLIHLFGKLVSRWCPSKTEEVLPLGAYRPIARRGPNLLCRKEHPILVSLATVALLAASCVPGADATVAVKGIGALPVVYQSWETHELSPQALAWQESWVGLGFTVRLADRAQRRETLEQLSKLAGDGKVSSSALGGAVCLYCDFPASTRPTLSPHLT